MFSGYEAGCPEREDSSKYDEVAENVAEVSPDSELFGGDASCDHINEGKSGCDAEKLGCK